jgi:hypothetical protein
MSYFQRMAQRAVQKSSSLSPRIPSLYEGSSSPEVETVETPPPSPRSEKDELQAAPTEPWPRRAVAEERLPVAPRLTARGERAPEPRPPESLEPPLSRAPDRFAPPPPEPPPGPSRIRETAEPPVEPRPPQPRAVEARPRDRAQPRPNEPEAPQPRALEPRGEVAAAQPDTIRVHIGRVDVRAIFPAPSPAPAPRQATPRAPALSLDGFLSRGKTR